MSEKETSATGTGGSTVQPKRLDYKQRVEHFAKGYDNAQSVVRFLDTKASAVIAAVPLVITAIGALFAMVKDFGRWEKAFSSDHRTWLWLPLLLFAAATIVLLWKAIATVKAAFDAIKPQKPLDAKPSVIFPYEQTYQQLTGADHSFSSRAELFQTTANEDDAFEDWKRQTVRMSEIVRQKLNCVNNSVNALKIFFVAALFMLFIIVATTATGSIIGATTQPTPPATVTPTR